MPPTRNSTTLYFIRHGQTASNAHSIKQGTQIDDYLNAQGIEQVKLLVPVIRHMDLDMLFTSYLHRAEESAALIDRGLPEPLELFHDYRLRERDFGSLTGKSEEEWLKAMPNYKDLE